MPDPRANGNNLACPSVCRVPQVPTLTSGVHGGVPVTSRGSACLQSRGSGPRACKIVSINRWAMPSSSVTRGLIEAVKWGPGARRACIVDRTPSGLAAACSGFRPYGTPPQWPLLHSATGHGHAVLDEDVQCRAGPGEEVVPRWRDDRGDCGAFGAETRAPSRACSSNVSLARSRGAMPS